MGLLSVQHLTRCVLAQIANGRYQDGPGWEIGGVCAQVTWNILLQEVGGGEAVVYDRFWNNTADEEVFKEGNVYNSGLIKGYSSKNIKYEVGDLHFFNSRWATH